MTKLGFACGWINCIMACVESVTFSERVNWQFSETTPSLSTFFLLCVEGLSYMIKEYGEGHLSKGISIGINSPWVSHLMFADDYILFSQATQQGAMRLQNILDLYQQGSGQMVNNSKYAIFFSANCDVDVKQVIHNETGITTEALVEKYLGLPMVLGRSTDEHFESIVTKLKSLVREWSPKLMNGAAREALVKLFAKRF